MVHLDQTNYQASFYDNDGEAGPVRGYRQDRAGVITAALYRLEEHVKQRNMACAAAGHFLFHEDNDSYFMPRNSTSKISVEFGGMPGLP